ncbi:MAG: hypothetical protein COA69_07115 [Robiginitomaculum sp.]|nr:MAG: hypothetical protein COA69_07115 [Robiginitomaculum sp.]
MNGSMRNFGLNSQTLKLITSSRRHTLGTKYVELSDAERHAYVLTHSALKEMGEVARGYLKEPEKFELRMTSGFNPKSGIRGYIPKDLWFAIFPKINKEALAANPQLFMIISDRGIEYGFGAAVHPSQFSTQSLKKLVRNTAPAVFDQLPLPESAEAIKIENAILNQPETWFFRKKHRQPPQGEEFSSFHSWLSYLQSQEGYKNAAGCISRYEVADSLENMNLNDALKNMTQIFEPLLDRDWVDSIVVPPISATRSKETFEQVFTAFLKALELEKGNTFNINEPLKKTMDDVISWLRGRPAVTSRRHLNLKLSVGNGNWASVPWLALMDERITKTTQKGIYGVFLISEDLSTIFLTLNQGITDLVKTFGQKNAELKMHEIASEVRGELGALESEGFILDNNISLGSSASNAKNYEKATIAHIMLQSKNLPEDDQIDNLLETLLVAYDDVVRLKGKTDEKETVVTTFESGIENYDIEDALKDLFLNRDTLEEYLEIWHSKTNMILQGAPGVGKSFTAQRLAYALLGAKDPKKIQMVQFHQSYSYEDFVQGYRPNGAQGFVLENGIFYTFCETARDDPQGKYVLIIDEINRGNLSKIFGELMLLIEPDKRDPSWATRLTYAGSGTPHFYVPPNLYILGMMNTADRSLSLVDYALRRRFAFANLKPLFHSPKFKAHLSGKGVADEVIQRISMRMGVLNQDIAGDRNNLGPGFQIGHSFFTPTSTVHNSEVWYERVIKTEIAPLLQEYWFDDPDKVEQHLSQLSN